MANGWTPVDDAAFWEVGRYHLVGGQWARREGDRRACPVRRSKPRVIPTEIHATKTKTSAKAIKLVVRNDDIFRVPDRSPGKIILVMLPRSEHIDMIFRLRAI